MAKNYFPSVYLGAPICCFPGRDSSVGIATRCGLDGPGIESRWGGGEIFRTRPERPWSPPGFLYNGYRVFSEGKAVGRGVDHSPHLVPRLKKE
jgi:hypothetical protein